MSQFLQFITDENNEPIFNENLDNEGIVDDAIVETHFCPIESILLSENKFIRIQADFNEINVEVRLTFDTLEKLIELIKGT